MEPADSPHVAESPRRSVRLVYDVEDLPGRFLLPEEHMPEVPFHVHASDVLISLLRAWAARAGRDVFVARNLGCRWHRADARVGVDPDVCLLDPAPKDLFQIGALRTWLPGHRPPTLSVEVVSPTTVEVDYRDKPTRYGLLGTDELWIFDPTLMGPDDSGGPFVLQVWLRQGAQLVRVYAGNGPVQSPGLGAWLIPDCTARELRLADDAENTQPWPTEAEAARTEAEAARTEAEAARNEAEAARSQAEAARELAERENVELRERLRRLEGG